MKKVLALILALMMVLGMTAIATADESDELYIGIVAPATTHGWVGGVSFFAQQAADESGVKYTMLTGNNAEEMSSNVEQLVSLGVDGIVIWPQFVGVGAACEKAIDAGIVIYNFDMTVDMADEYLDSDLYYYLGGDNYGMGVGSAEFIVSVMGTTGTVLVMDVPGSGNVAELRMAGFMDTMADIAPEVEFITIATEFNREKGLTDMADALSANAEINAAFSMDDETSIGALQAIVEAGRTDVLAITGGGGCQEYFNMMDDEEYEGIAISSATYLPNMISSCVENLIAVLEGAELDHNITLPTNIVALENVADFLNEDSPY